jgi:modulator of FtsH protease HflK
VNKVMIDKNSSGAGGVVPYLPLPELRSGQPATPGPPRTAPPAPGATR